MSARKKFNIFVGLLNVALLAGDASMQLVAQDDNGDRQQEPNQLTVSPAPETTYSYDVRLFPDRAKREHANAATVFLVTAWGLSSEYWENIDAALKETRLKIPIDKFTRDEHSTVFGRYEELKRAANCSFSDWNRDIYNNSRFETVLLPDVQQSRLIMYALALQIRADIAENKLEEAIEKLRVGFGLIRHLQNSPFFVVKLSAVLNTNFLLDQVEELVQRPNCPNLYWALHQIPSPFVDGRNIGDFESAMMRELRNLDEVKTQEAWDQLANRIKLIFGGIPNTDPSSDKDAAQQDQIKLGRAGLADSKEYSKKQVAEMSTSEIEVRWYAKHYLKWTDNYN